MKDGNRIQSAHYTIICGEIQLQSIKLSSDEETTRTLNRSKNIRLSVTCVKFKWKKSIKGREVLKFLLPFTYLYLCDSGCPTPKVINTKLYKQ